MSLSVIDKFVAKKEKDLLDYAKILEAIITVDDNKMWQKKSEFNGYAKEIIKTYAEEYYFKNNTHKDNPIEYSNDNINYVLKAIIKYLESINEKSKLKVWKNEIFLLSVIVCTSAYVDFATNIVDGDFSDTKAKFKYLLGYLKKTSIIHINDNKYWVSDLFDLIKKNTSNDEKVFLTIQSDNYHNEYNEIAPSVYKVDFVYNIPGLEDFKKDMALKVLASYEESITEISYDLLAFKILEDLISNKEMGLYLIDGKSTLKKTSILKLFDNDYYREYVNIVIPWQDKEKYDKVIKEYKLRNILIVYEYLETSNVDAKIFKNGTTILVNKEFVKNNLDNELAFKKNNIKLIIMNEKEN